MHHITYGDQERVLLMVSGLEAEGYTRADSEATRGPREYFLAYSSKGTHAKAEKRKASAWY